MTRNRVIALVLAVVAVAGLLVVRHARVKELDQAPVLAQSAAAVQVAAVRRGTVASVDHVLGEVYGADEAEVAPQVAGQVVTVTVREGAPVAAGDVLARLDARELDDGVAAGQADVESARAAYGAQTAATARDRVLFVNKAIAQEQWEGSRALRAAATGRLEVARRHLDQARTRLGYAVVRAPFSGVVSARLADPGDLALSGKPLFKVVRQSAVRVRGAIPSALAAVLRPGTPVELALGGTALPATVARVFPAMDASHLGTFEVDVANPSVGLVAGATVGVDLHLRTGSGLVVPLDALLEGDAGTFTYVVDAGRDGRQTLRMVPVRVSTRSQDEAVVAGGLGEGDRVVVARPSRLMELAAGMTVTPTPVPGAASASELADVPVAATPGR